MKYLVFGGLYVCLLTLTNCGKNRTEFDNRVQVTRAAEEIPAPREVRLIQLKREGEADPKDLLNGKWISDCIGAHKYMVSVQNSNQMEITDILYRSEKECLTPNFVFISATPKQYQIARWPGARLKGTLYEGSPSGLVKLSSYEITQPSKMTDNFDDFSDALKVVDRRKAPDVLQLGMLTTKLAK